MNMESVILEYVKDNWPTLALLAGVAFGVGKLVFFATRWEDQNEQRHRNSEQRHSNVENALKDISMRVGTIERFLIKNGGADYNEFTQMNSPRQLNPKGRKLYNESGAALFLEKNKERLLQMLTDKMDELPVKTALDVEMFAQRVCWDISTDEGFKPVKDYIYTHPVFDGSDVSLDIITMLMGLELRNEYLKIHPEIDPTSE